MRNIFVLLSLLVVSVMPDTNDHNTEAAALDNRLLKASGGSAGGGKGTTTGSTTGGDGVGGATGVGGSGRGSFHGFFVDNDGTETRLTGSCCNNKCCSDGPRFGYALFWYSGYRPSTVEGKVLENNLEQSVAELETLKNVNGTDIATKECVSNTDGTSVESSLLVDGGASTLKAEIESVISRMNATIKDVEEEIKEWDLRDDINAILRDFRRLKPCFATLTDEDQVNATLTEVADVEILVSDWDYVLEYQSAGFSFACTKVLFVLGIILGVTLL